MEPSEKETTRRISIDLPNKLIEKFDQLKKEWGLRARGAVLERLLEIVLSDEEEGVDNTEEINFDNKVINTYQTQNAISSEYNEETSLVLIQGENNISLEEQINKGRSGSYEKRLNNNQKSQIDLPGFVRKKGEQLKSSLGSKKRESKFEEPFLSSVKDVEVKSALKAANNHWLTLYGQAPKDTVVEAAMTWFAIDIWKQLEGTDQLPFTWTAANKLMAKYLATWEIKEPNFERIIVIAGVLEDPFGTNSLAQRMPSLIRRFVNRFKKSHKVTSFQTLESTMTVHGALKLLGLPTTAGSSLTLQKIRESYKQRALAFHPDAGGTTESMRRLNEAYQLLKELYRSKK